VEIGSNTDVLVAGGGNAGMCAAITARLCGASVLVLEAAPKGLRGGNSRHTRNLRCAHDSPADVLTGTYSEEEYWEDLLQVTQGQTNESLARLTIRESASCRVWMAQQGARFQPSLSGTLHLSRTNAFFLGGGKALLNAYYRTAAGIGIDVVYGAEVRDLEIKEGRFESALVVQNGRIRTVRAGALVAASGGFQGNLDWLKRIWGDPADRFIIRGTPYDTGTVLSSLMDRGIQTVGEPSQCHAVAVDARTPRFDAGIVSRVDSIPFGIVVNREARRFYDEGEDLWPKRYAIWGRLIARQPGQAAYSIFDSKSSGLFIPPVFRPLEAGSIRELAAALGLDSAALESTVADFNRAARPGAFDPVALDSCGTRELDPPKSHWARPLDSPPYYAYPLRPGITFTYLGVVVDERAKVRLEDGRAAENIYAAGEIMAGNILGEGYLAGIGMTIGTVFGRIAGREAARRISGSSDPA